MAVNTVPGSIIGVRIGGAWLSCQVDATLNITVNVTEDDPCKPDPSDLNVQDTPWVERTADSRDWNIDFSQKLMRNSLVASNSNIGDLIVSGNLDVDVEFMTRPGQKKSDYDFVYAGSGIITNFTFNAPGTGAATTDSTISGNGALTYTQVPVTS